jgi:hypothetical protein
MSRPDPAMSHLGYARIANDFYETPPDVGAVLGQPPLVHLLRRRKIWEPAYGRGALIKPLAKVIRGFVASDVVDHTGDGTVQIADMLTLPRPLGRVAVTNPPFDQADPFARRLIEWLDAGLLDTVILLARATWTHAASRNALMNHPAMAAEVRLSWRPRWIADSDGSPRHDYVWLAWDRRSVGTPAHVSYAQRPPEL